MSGNAAGNKSVERLQLEQLLVRASANGPAKALDISEAIRRDEESRRPGFRDLGGTMERQ